MSGGGGGGGCRGGAMSERAMIEEKRSKDMLLN